MATQSKAHMVFTRTLGSWVQIPLDAWTCVCVFLCSVLCR